MPELLSPTCAWLMRDEIFRSSRFFLAKFTYELAGRYAGIKCQGQDRPSSKSANARIRLGSVVPSPRNPQVGFSVDPRLEVDHSNGDRNSLRHHADLCSSRVQSRLMAMAATARPPKSSSAQMGSSRSGRPKELTRGVGRSRGSLWFEGDAVDFRLSLQASWDNGWW